MSTRFIAVDDTSPRISYQGPWFQQSSTSSSPGGLSFKNTLTGIDESGSFSLDFTGTSVSVIGSFSNNTSTWTCSIDGNTLISTDISSVNMMENNIEICGLSSIKTSPSHLSVEVSASDGNGTFYLDYIRYAPNASAILDDATIVYPNDSQIHYDSNWVSLNGKLETSGQNASMTFDCIGTQIEWITGPSFGNVLSNASIPTASYSINNGNTYPIKVAPYSSLDDYTTLLNVPLSPGSNHLSIQYNGSNGSVPLTLNYFIVQNLTSSRGLSRGGVAGAVIGSLVGFALIVFILIRCIKGPKAPAGLGPVPHNDEDGR